MANRKKVSGSGQADVLVKSRRRCCICFGLHRDENRKKGQIAHLDRNRNNNNIDNLAYLCLDHHDEYDGKTSQAKNLTKNEVMNYRKELYAYCEAFSAQIGNSKVSTDYSPTCLTDEDIIVLLKDWWPKTNELLPPNVTVNFSEVDCQLSLPPGSTKKHIMDVALKEGFKISSSGNVVAMFEFVVTSEHFGTYFGPI